MRGVSARAGPVPTSGGDMIFEEIANCASAKELCGMGKLGGTSTHAHIATWNTPDRQERET